jgi:hypothetical protein
MKWTKRELALLHLKYDHSSWSELLTLLPNRSKNSIKKKARNEGLYRGKFDTRKGVYFKFAMCRIHGRVDRSKIIWKNKNKSIGYCPICRSRLRLLPKATKLRRKYRRTKDA